MLLTMYTFLCSIHLKCPTLHDWNSTNSTFVEQQPFIWPFLSLWNHDSAFCFYEFVSFNTSHKWYHVVFFLSIDITKSVFHVRSLVCEAAESEFEGREAGKSFCGNVINQISDLLFSFVGDGWSWSPLFCILHVSILENFFYFLDMSLLPHCGARRYGELLFRKPIVATLLFSSPNTDFKRNKLIF